MERLVDAARAAGIVHVASADDHELTDPEISDAPDFRNDLSAALPARHARRAQDPGDGAGRPGAAHARAAPPSATGRRAREFLLLKKNFDVFTNPEHRAGCSTRLDPEEIVVFGVATDVCDDAAIRGFLSRGLSVRFVEDAVEGPRRRARGGLHGLLAGKRGRVHHRSGGRRKLSS